MKIHFIYSNGTRFIILFILIYLIFAGFGYELIGIESSGLLYKQIKWRKSLMIMFFLTVFFSFFDTGYLRHQYIYSKFLGRKFQIFILILLDIIAFWGYVSGNSNFRYSTEGISEKGGLVLLLSCVNTMLMFFLMVLLFYKQDGIKENKVENRLIQILFGIGIFFSINGNASALLALLYLAKVIYPKTLDSLLFKEQKNVFTIMFLMVLIIPVIITVNIYGESIKVGLPLTLAIQNFNLGEYLNYFIDYFFGYVLSPNYISFKNAINTQGYKSDIFLNIKSLNIPIQNFVFRLNTLFNFNSEIVKADISSISILNYNEITESEFLRPREGTTPGFFGTFFLCFSFPFNFIFLFFSLRGLRKFIDILCSAMKKKISFLGLIVLMYFFILGVISDPLDFLILIDNAVIYAFLFFIFIKFSLKKVE